TLRKFSFKSHSFYGGITIRVNGQQAVREPRLWLLGYGSWCGPASATLLGAGRVARSMVRQLAAWLASPI
ncbi:MAG: hypothetical protein ABF569_14135, partial [Acetobacter sp.]